MYLSKLELDRGRTAHHYISNPNALHGALCAAAGASRADSQLMHRVIGDRHRNAVYTYSDAPLDVEALPPHLTLTAQRDISAWLHSLNPNTLLAFDLVAAPTRKIHNQNSHNSRRVILRDQEERLDWVRDRCSPEGCQVLNMDEKEEVRSRIHKGSEHRTFYVSGYRYSGLLQVQDPGVLEQLLRTGIGPEKAYGYGMLLVRPL